MGHQTQMIEPFVTVNTSILVRFRNSLLLGGLALHHQGRDSVGLLSDERCRRQLSYHHPQMSRRVEPDICSLDALDAIIYCRKR